MKYLTTLLAATILASCSPAVAEEVCDETYASVQELAVQDGFTVLETDDVAGAISIIEPILGPVPNDIAIYTVLFIAVVPEGGSLVAIGFIDATGCVIGSAVAPVEIVPLIFG